jgi:hypothetical protein
LDKNGFEYFKFNVITSLFYFYNEFCLIVWLVRKQNNTKIFNFFCVSQQNVRLLISIVSIVNAQSSSTFAVDEAQKSLIYSMQWAVLATQNVHI